MSARNKIAFFLLFSYGLLLWHDLIPHHHAIGKVTSVTVIPEHHTDDHIHYFTNFHTAHPASSTSEIIHFQYQQARRFNQSDLAPAVLPENSELRPPELLKKPVKAWRPVVPVHEVVTIPCGLRAPPVA